MPYKINNFKPHILSADMRLVELFISIYVYLSNNYDANYTFDFA